jgi:hypothetical protein
MMRPRTHLFLLLLWAGCLLCAIAANDDKIEVDDEPHPDPNEENYPGMIYIGRMNDEGKRVGFEADNGRMNVSII